MTGTYLILIMTYSIINFLIALVFKISNKRLRSNHNKDVKGLLASISINKIQLEKRSKGLDRYDLLTHNIEESLVAQEEISVEFP